MFFFVLNLSYLECECYTIYIVGDDMGSLSSSDAEAFMTKVEDYLGYSSDVNKITTIQSSYSTSILTAKNYVNETSFANWTDDVGKKLATLRTDLVSGYRNIDESVETNLGVLKTQLDKLMSLCDDYKRLYEKRPMPPANIFTTEEDKDMWSDTKTRRYDTLTDKGKSEYNSWRTRQYYSPLGNYKDEIERVLNNIKGITFESSAIDEDSSLTGDEFNFEDELEDEEPTEEETTEEEETVETETETSRFPEGSSSIDVNQIDFFDENIKADYEDYGYYETDLVGSDGESFGTVTIDSVQEDGNVRVLSGTVETDDGSTYDFETTITLYNFAYNPPQAYKQEMSVKCGDDVMYTETKYVNAKGQQQSDGTYDFDDQTTITVDNRNDSVTTEVSERGSTYILTQSQADSSVYIFTSLDADGNIENRYVGYVDEDGYAYEAVLNDNPYLVATIVDGEVKVKLSGEDDSQYVSVSESGEISDVLENSDSNQFAINVESSDGTNTTYVVPEDGYLKPELSNMLYLTELNKNTTSDSGRRGALDTINEGGTLDVQETGSVITSYVVGND